MMRVSMKLGALAGAALVLSFCGGARAADLKIAAAANLQKALTDSLIPAFEKQSGATVTPTFGSTKLLAKQLENGAPEDVFVSADTETVAKLVSEGQLDGATRKVYAIGRLVMWTRKDARLHPRRIQDLANPAYAKIAVANPRLAPYGLAARQSFAAAGLTASVASRLAVAENIAQALQYARSGNADVSLTALSLVIDDRDDPYVIVPDRLHAPIAQAAAVVKASKQQDLARKFLTFLTSKDAAPIWKKYGYELPGRVL